MRCCTCPSKRIASALLVPRTLKNLLRVVTAVLVIGLLARTGKAAPAERPTGFTNAEAFALMLAGQNGECSMEDHENPLVLCGVDIFGDFVEDAQLLMPADTCSVLLEELFKDQICAPGDVECQEANRGAIPVPAQKLAQSGGTSSSSGLFGDDDDGIEAAARSRWRALRSVPVPESRGVAPPVPPPELRA